MDFKERAKIFIGSHKLAIAVGLLALVVLYKKFFAAKTCSGSANTAPVCTCTAQCLNQRLQPCYSSPSTIQYTLWNPPTLATTQQEVVILEASNHERSSSVQVEPVEQPLIEKTASQIV